MCLGGTLISSLFLIFARSMLTDGDWTEEIRLLPLAIFLGFWTSVGLDSF